LEIAQVLYGLAEVKRLRPDLVILDLILPKLSGLDVCTEIRRDPHTRNIPVLMLTGRSDEADRVAGLEVGADDYMVKPFSLRELAARVRALLRRWDREPGAEPEESEPQRLQFGDLVLEPEERRVMLAGTEAKLTPMEFRLLHLLASHPNKAFAREDLLNKIWGQARHVTLRSVDTCFWRLREKIEKDSANAVYMKTVRGVGYMFSMSKAEVEGKVLPIRARSTSA
jgi:DNA-binding response OmpR family regulator